MNKKPTNIDEWKNLSEYEMFKSKNIDLPHPDYPNAQGCALTINFVNPDTPIAYAMDINDPFFWWEGDKCFKPVKTKCGWFKERYGFMEYIVEGVAI